MEVLKKDGVMLEHSYCNLLRNNLCNNFVSTYQVHDCLALSIFSLLKLTARNQIMTPRKDKRELKPAVIYFSVFLLPLPSSEDNNQ